jgi:distribution and morphology protein 12
MSVDIQWETLTAGPDGVRLAESICAFIHDRFQQVTLPRFIRSVRVHSFDFGCVAPEIELKDICNPLPDFYEDEDDDANPSEEDEMTNKLRLAQTHLKNGKYYQRQPHHVDTGPAGFLDSLTTVERPASPAFAIPGGTSSLAYFHLPLGAGLSGTATPLAAVAGAHFHKDWQGNASERRGQDSSQQAPVSMKSWTPPSTADDPSSRPPSQHYQDASDADFSIAPCEETRMPSAPSRCTHEPNPQDIQVVAHVRYSGDLKLSLTAEILLDYPTPSFVGIPLKLNITGMTFNGVAILAFIRKRAHFCFLSPEDADALVGREDDLKENNGGAVTVGGLLEDIRVESEIGDKDHGGQVLKNVGKVERFVLEQVRRIFEDEFVYPSFWTFLV